MGLLMLLISLILGFIVTIVINRVRTMYYCFLFIIFVGIGLLIHYWDSLFPIIQVIEFVIIFRFLTVLAFIFVRLVVVPRNKP